MAAAAPATPPPVATMRANRAADLLQRFDQNHDGKLDEDETAAAHEEMLKEQMNRQAAVAAAPGGDLLRQRMLEMFDKNHDGRLDDDERAEMQKYNRAQGAGPGGAPLAARERFVRQFDNNGDGKIDDAEWIAARERVIQMLVEASTLANRPEQIESPAQTKARLERVAAEVARRRAEREQAKAQVDATGGK